MQAKSLCDGSIRKRLWCNKLRVSVEREGFIRYRDVRRDGYDLNCDRIEATNIELVSIDVRN